jgi:hypothetical protein
MVGTRQGKFMFGCPLCGARPGKPCVEPKGRRKGQTCKAHLQRVQRYRKAVYGHLDDVKAIWVNAVETNRSRH